MDTLRMVNSQNYTDEEHWNPNEVRKHKFDDIPTMFNTFNKVTH